MTTTHRSVLTAALGAGVLAAGLAATVAAVAPASATPAPTGRAAANGVRVIYDCEHAKAEPRSILQGCNDSTFFIHSLRYSEWTPTEAKASGAAYVDDCVPDCAAGHFHTYAINIRLYQPVSRPHGPLFSTMNIHFVGAKPAGLKSRITTALDTKPE